MILALLMFAILVPLLAVLWSQLRSPGPNLTVTPGWIEGLSADRYDAMLRLLSQDDSKALRTQPGYTPQMATRLRVQRCRVLQGYLRSLDADFKRICLALKIIMLRSEHDRPDLAGVLLRSQILFAGGMVVVRFRLWLFRWTGVSVDVTSVLSPFEVMRQRLCERAPATVL